MTVIRVVHNQENPFVQLNKKALWDERLSLKAVGLWARCMSRPDDWRFNIKELTQKSKEGRRAIDGAIQELICFGYAVRLEHWDKAEDGKFLKGGVEYVFFEFPATQEDKDKVLEEFKKFFRHCGFGNCRNGDSRNDHLLIKKETKKEGNQEPSISPKPGIEEKPVLEKPVAKKPEVEKQKWGAYVEITEQEFLKLINVYGRNVVHDIFESINDHITNNRNGKGYKDYCAAFRTFYKNQSKRNPQWKPKNTSNDSKAISLDKSMPEQVLVPLSSIMDTRDCFSPG